MRTTRTLAAALAAGVLTSTLTSGCTPTEQTQAVCTGTAEALQIISAHLHDDLGDLLTLVKPFVQEECESTLRSLAANPSIPTTLRFAFGGASIVRKVTGAELTQRPVPLASAATGRAYSCLRSFPESMLLYQLCLDGTLAAH